MTTLLNIAIPDYLIRDIGWMLIGVAVINIVVNMGLMVFSTVMETVDSCKKKRIKKKIYK